MSEKTPCNCHQPPEFGVAALPSVSGLRSALELAIGGLTAGGTNPAYGTLPTGEVADPPVAVTPAPPASPAPLAVDHLAALLAVARANPGLKITLSF